MSQCNCCMTLVNMMYSDCNESSRCHLQYRLYLIVAIVKIHCKWTTLLAVLHTWLVVFTYNVYMNCDSVITSQWNYSFSFSCCTSSSFYCLAELLSVRSAVCYIVVGKNASVSPHIKTVAYYDSFMNISYIWNLIPFTCSRDLWVCKRLALWNRHR